MFLVCYYPKFNIINKPILNDRSFPFFFFVILSLSSSCPRELFFMIIPTSLTHGILQALTHGILQGCRFPTKPPINPYPTTGFSNY